MTRRVLFICTHNSARSQMAEGMLRAWGGRDWEAHSAGVEASFVRLEAIEAMEEIGIDINDQQSKSLDRYVGQRWDFVIPVCEEGAAAWCWTASSPRSTDVPRKRARQPRDATT